MEKGGGAGFLLRDVSSSRLTLSLVLALPHTGFALGGRLYFNYIVIYTKRYMVNFCQVFVP